MNIFTAISGHLGDILTGIKRASSTCRDFSCFVKGDDSTVNTFFLFETKKKINGETVQLAEHAHLTAHYTLDADGNAWSFAINAPYNTEMNEVYIGTYSRYAKYVCQFFCDEVVGN